MDIKTLNIPDKPITRPAVDDGTDTNMNEYSFPKSYYNMPICDYANIKDIWFVDRNIFVDSNVIREDIFNTPETRDESQLKLMQKTIAEKKPLQISTQISVYECKILLGSFMVKNSKVKCFIFKLRKIIGMIDHSIYWKLENMYIIMEYRRRLTKLPVFKIYITRGMNKVMRHTKNGLRWIKPKFSACQNIQF